jgi:AcrR family transcriptional regulator
MSNKEIQEQRMREYFIQACKDLLKGEGLRSVSVRSVADRAGYSFATMYNYFRDINDLLFLCVSDFQKECNEFVAEHVKKSPLGEVRLQKAVQAYMEYFVEYPGIFELFFMARKIDFGNRENILALINNSLKSATAVEWDYCIQKGILTKTNAASKISLLQSYATGVLIHYINRLQPDSYDDFTRKIKKEIKTILS